MQFVRQITFNTLYQVFARIISSGTSFLILILIARMFNVGGYGDFAKVTAFVTIFYLFIDLGCNAIFLQQDEIHVHFFDLLLIRFISAAILYGVIVTITFSLPYDSLSGIGFSLQNKGDIMLFAFTLFAQAIIYSTNALFQKHLAYQYTLLTTAIGSLTTLGFVWLFAITEKSLTWIFIAFIAGMFLQAICSLLFSKFAYQVKGISKAFIKKLLRETFPVTLMLVFNLIYFRIDMIILSFFRPSSDVALYSVAYSIFDFLIALPLFLSNSLYPKLLEAVKNKRTLIANEKKYYGVFLMLGIVTVFIVWFLAPYILVLIRPNFLLAIIPLRIFLLSLPLFFLTSIMQWILLAKKQQKFLAVVYGSFMVLNIVSNLLFIPSYGYIASAIITAIGESLIALIFLIKILW